MGEYIEEIGGWVDKYIFIPICRICMLIIWIIIIASVLCIPVAAIKYLLTTM